MFQTAFETGLTSKDGGAVSPAVTASWIIPFSRSAFQIPNIDLAGRNIKRTAVEREGFCQPRDAMLGGCICHRTLARGVGRD